nr:ABC-three component system protein [uncultured Chitinophaga sp.]
MISFPFENLNETEFENLVIRICKSILGIGCKTFSIGKDGGKDSYFEGEAQCYPSTTLRWQGKFIIQAKHVNSPEASCSDNEFSVNKSSVLSKEIGRLQAIKEDFPFDCYIIFTNRKLTGGAHPIIINKLKSELEIEKAEIIGKEQMSTYLNDYPEIATQLGSYKFMAPLRFYEKDIKEVILTFDKHSKNFDKMSDGYLKSFDMIDKEQKNRLNNLSRDYFDFIISHSLQYFEEIGNFLKEPKNDQYLKMYRNTVGDLQERIILERNRFNEFEHIIKHLTDHIVGNNEENLRDLRGLVRVFTHFMYFNCDIGKVK